MDSKAPEKRRWHEILTALTPLILGLAVTSVGAVFTQVYNFRQLQLNQLSALEKLRPLLVSEKPYEREFAYASFAALGYEKLALKIIRLKQDTAGRAVIEEIKQSGSASVQQEASAALFSVPPRVFIHIGSDTQRAKAKHIAAMLTERGFVVPGVENVAGKADLPQKTNVRYFNAEDKAAAEAIAELLHKEGVKDAYAYNVTRFKVKPGSLEVWFSSDAI